MKKVLSLVLVLTMVLGSFTFAFADAATTTADASKYDALVESGLFGQGGLRLDEDLTRAQFATVALRASGYTDEQVAEAGVAADFADVPEGHFYYNTIGLAQELGLVQGDGTNFNPSAAPTNRQVVVVLLRILGHAQEANAGYATNAHMDLAQDLGFNVANVNPTAPANRGVVADLLVDFLEIQAPLEIEAVTVLTEDGRYVELEFNKALTSLERSDVRVANSVSEERVGIKEVELASNGLTATIEFFESTTSDLVNTIEKGETYTITVTANREVAEIDFERPNFVRGRVIEIDAEDREITVRDESSDKSSDEVVTFLEDFYVDFEEIFGLELRVWYNDDDEVTRFVVGNNDVRFDAIEVEIDGDDTEITLVDADVDFDLAEDAVIWVNGKDDISLVDGDEFDYAKVVIENRKIVFVNAYNWTDFIVVEEADKDVVYGFGDELDVEDFTIVREGRTITFEDLIEGDILFYYDNVDYEYAEVFNSFVAGDIDYVFEEEFEVDGQSFDYFNENIEKSVRYIDEDGDIEDFDEDAAEQMEEEGPVTVFVDRFGDAVFVDGELGEVETSTFGGFLFEDIDPYLDVRNREYLAIEVVTENDSDVVYNVRLSDLEEITIDGDVVWDDDDEDLEFDSNITLTEIKSNGTTIVDLTADYASAGAVIEITVDEYGNIVELGFFENDVSSFTGEEYELDENYIEGRRINSSTVVFMVEDWYDDKDDEDDIEATTWGELEGFEVKAGAVYFDGRDVEYLVITETDLEETTDFYGVLTEIRRNTDGEVTRVRALVDGVEETYFTEDPEDFDKFSFEAGDAVVIAIYDNTGRIESIDKFTNEIDYVTNDSFAVNVRDREVSTGSEVYELARDGYIYDITDPEDIEEMTLSELRRLEVGTRLDFVIDEDSVTTDGYLKFILVHEEGAEDSQSDSDSDSETEAEGTVTYIVDAEENTVESLTVDAEASNVNLNVMFTNDTNEDVSLPANQVDWEIVNRTTGVQEASGTFGAARTVFAEATVDLGNFTTTVTDAGEYFINVEVSDANDVIATERVNLTVAGADAASYEVENVTNHVAGDALTVTVRAEDANNNLDANYDETVTLTLTSNEDGEVFNEEVTFANGTVTVTIPADELVEAATHTITVATVPADLTGTFTVVVVPSNVGDFDITAITDKEQFEAFDVVTANLVDDTTATNDIPDGNYSASIVSDIEGTVFEGTIAVSSEAFTFSDVVLEQHGAHTLTVTIDGHSETVAVTVTEDDTAPVVHTDGLTAANFDGSASVTVGVVATGTGANQIVEAQSGVATVTLTIAGTDYAGTVNATGDTVTFTNVPAVSAGVNFTIIMTDNAGNTNTQILTFQ